MVLNVLMTSYELCVGEGAANTGYSRWGGGQEGGGGVMKVMKL